MVPFRPMPEVLQISADKEIDVIHGVTRGVATRRKISLPASYVFRYS